MRGRLLAFTLAILVFIPTAAFAVEPQEVMADPKLEARARVLSQELRCLVCQNQSIDDSNADLARDLRVLVRERLAAGDTDPQVLAFIEARYGEFVLLRPRFNSRTLLLWFTPLLLLAAAGYIILRSRASNGIDQKAQPLTADEQRRLEHLLKSKP